MEFGRREGVLSLTGAKAADVATTLVLVPMRGMSESNRILEVLTISTMDSPLEVLAIPQFESLQTAALLTGILAVAIYILGFEYARRLLALDERSGRVDLYGYGGPAVAMAVVAGLNALVIAQVYLG